MKGIERYFSGMSPINAMILSAIGTAVAATTTLATGAIFKRAFDAWHQERAGQLRTTSAIPIAKPERDTNVTRAQDVVTVNEVKSVDQKGGVTTGYVGSVTQTETKN